MSSRRGVWSALFVLIVIGSVILLLPLSPRRSGSQPFDLGFPEDSSATAITPRMQRADLPLYFEANQGQTDTRVKFLSRGAGYTLFLTSEGPTLSLLAAQPNSSKPSATHDRRAARAIPSAPAHYSTSSVQLKLVGANAGIAVTGDSPHAGKVNYFIGK